MVPSSSPPDGPVFVERRFRRRAQSSARLLIVDDDLVAAGVVAEALRTLGHQTIVATQWTEAVRNFGPQIDLVLMDAVMPTVDGFKLTRILRSRALSYVPILFLTGLDDAAARERGMEAGADDFLTKPVDPMELRVRVAAMLRIRRLTQELEAERAIYARLAHIDELTGLPNRRSYDERVQVELEYARRSGRPMSLLLLDIDHFKSINDELGHAVGDQVLAFTGALLRETIRRDDLAFRYGGEEFVLLARDTDITQSAAFAERVRKLFEARSPDTPGGVQTCSIGAATFTPSAEEPSDVDEAEREAELFTRADANLYAAKEAGRNCVVVG